MGDSSCSQRGCDGDGTSGWDLGRGRTCVRTSERQRSLQAPTRSAAMIIPSRTCLEPASIPILGCAQGRDATMPTSRVPCARPDERLPVGDAAAVQDQWRNEQQRLSQTLTLPGHTPRTHYTRAQAKAVFTTACNQRGAIHGPPPSTFGSRDEIDNHGRM
jgi:hypothetical protein